MVFLDGTPDLPSSWLVNPDHITVAAMLVFLVLGLLKGWLVPGPMYEALRAERDQLRADAAAMLKAYQEREDEERQWRAEKVRHGLARREEP